MESIDKYFKSPVDKYIFILNHLDGRLHHDFIELKRRHYSFPIEGVGLLTGIRDVLMSDPSRVNEDDLVLALQKIDKDIAEFQRWEDEKEEFKDDRVILTHPNGQKCEREFDRVFYGHEMFHTTPPPPNCIECLCQYNKLHVFGCKQEECPACGRKLMLCDCF